MDINYEEIADRAVEAAGKFDKTLDFSMRSIEDVDSILQSYFEHLENYEDEKGADILWNLAVHFGIYLGETLLRTELKEKGYEWYMDDGLPILRNEETNIKMSPITKAHKRLQNGPEDSVKSFCDVALAFARGDLPPRESARGDLPPGESRAVHRAVDVQLASGTTEENVPYRNIDNYIMLIERGEEDFLILNSQDGFLQFYGVNNQFVAEVRVNLADGDFRTYSIINKDKEQRMERIQLTTPYGQFTPTEREVISLELVKTVVKKYYECISETDLLKEIPYVDTTEITKRCMGLIK